MYRGLYRFFPGFHTPNGQSLQKPVKVPVNFYIASPKRKAQTAQWSMRLPSKVHSKQTGVGNRAVFLVQPLNHLVKDFFLQGKFGGLEQEGDRLAPAKQGRRCGWIFCISREGFLHTDITAWLAHRKSFQVETGAWGRAGREANRQILENCLIYPNQARLSWA